MNLMPDARVGGLEESLWSHYLLTFSIVQERAPEKHRCASGCACARVTPLCVFRTLSRKFLTY